MPLVWACRVAAAAARKSRKRAQQDCESALGEYDAELGARQKELEQGLTAYHDLQDKIKVGVMRSDGWRRALNTGKGETQV
jgi:hypothetical protein